MEKNFKIKIAYFCLLLLAGVFLCLNVCLGTVKVSFADIMAGFKGINSVNSDIIRQLRLPRALAAFFLGGALSLSGYLLQSYFRNPIASPFVLGVSSGAKLFVAFMMIFSLKLSVGYGSVSMIVAALVGALISMLFVLLIAGVIADMSMLIVSGIMISYICAAMTDFIVTFAADANIVNLHNWSLGSFSGITWDNVMVSAIVITICFIVSIFVSKELYAFNLGENYAVSLGVNIRLFRLVLIVLSSVLTATVTAFVGPVSFVGIAVPHIIKGIFKSSKPLILIPGCFLGGAIACLFSDLLARLLFAPTELAVSTVTAFWGAPVVIWILIRKKL